MQKNPLQNVKSISVIGDIMIDIIIDIRSDINHIFEYSSIDVDYGKITLGGAGNIAVALSQLGIQTIFIGKKGNDVLGEVYTKDLMDNHVKPILFEDHDNPTGIVISLLTTGGERTMLAIPGANKTLSPEEISEKKDEIQESSDALFIHGYSLFRDPQSFAILEMARYFYESNKPIIYDPANSVLMKKRPNLIQKLTEYSSIILMNEHEMQVLLDILKIKKIDEICDFSKLFVIKKGVNGATIIFGEKVIHSDSFNVPVRDTTGAGDSFDAAFIYALVKNFPFTKALIFANWFAAQTIMNYGARSFPDKEKVRKFIETKLQMRVV